MVTPESVSAIHFPSRHRQRSWLCRGDAWIDAALEQAHTALDTPLRQNASTSIMRRVSSAANDSVIIIKIADRIVGSIQTKKILTRNRIQEQYIELVKDVPEAVEVRLVEEADGQSLLTVISATPFDDEPRDKVFSAQLNILNKMESPLFGFHLVNVQELPSRSIDQLGSKMGKTVWRR